MKDLLIFNEDNSFENCKMILKGNLLNKLEHQWKQPLNLISTILLNMEIKSELDKLKHNDVKKLSENIESAIMKISNNISLLNRCFQSSSNKTPFSIKSVVEKNLNLLLYKIKQNNIELKIDSKTLNIEINNYENDVALNIMLFLYILVELSIKGKEKSIITLSCEKSEGDTNLCISLNKYFSFSSILEYYDIEFFLIENILAKTAMTYESELSDIDTLFKITVDRGEKL